MRCRTILLVVTIAATAGCASEEPGTLTVSVAGSEHTFEQVELLVSASSASPAMAEPRYATITSGSPEEVRYLLRVRGGEELSTVAWSLETDAPLGGVRGRRVSTGEDAGQLFVNLELPAGDLRTAGEADCWLEVESIDEERARGRFGGSLELVAPGSTVEDRVLGGQQPPIRSVEGSFDVPVNLMVDVE